MPDTVSCGIDTVRIRDLSDKIRCWIHGTTINKRTAVQIAIDFGSVIILTLTAHTTKDDLVSIAVHLLVSLLIDCIDVNESIVVGITDVTGNSKGEIEATLADAVATLEKRFGTVRINEGTLCFRGVITAANNLLGGITDDGGHLTIELLVHLSFTIIYMTCNLYCGTSANLKGFGKGLNILSVDRFDDNRIGGDSQGNGRVAQ